MWADPDAALPLLSDEERDDAKRALDGYAAAPRGSAPELIASLMGETAGVMPTRTGGEAEETLRVRVYQAELAQVDADVLKRAFSEARRTLTFFPSIAEILAIVGRLPAPPRILAAWRLRQLLAAEPARATPADVNPGDVAALLDGLGQRTAPTAPARPAERPEPIVADYEALGLSPAEAEQAWRDHQRILRRQPDQAVGRAIAA